MSDPWYQTVSVGVCVFAFAVCLFPVGPQNCDR